MPNTGVAIVLTLRQRNLTTNVLTGLTKPNLPGDPDYIPPGIDYDACPLEAGWECPVVTAYSPEAGKLYFEFEVPGSVVGNPTVARVTAEIFNAVPTLITTTSTALPPNYVGAILTLAAATYTIDVVYYDEDDVELHRCVATATVVVA